MPNATILLCAGSGSRMRGEGGDKLLLPLAGRPVLWHALNAFQTSGVVSRVLLTYRDEAQRRQLAAALNDQVAGLVELEWVPGGAERQDSVGNALEAIGSLDGAVFIHDCARPLIHRVSLVALLQAVEQDGAAVLAHRVVDTIKDVRATRRSLRQRRLRDLPREHLWAMETPQVFAFPLIQEAYRSLREAGLKVTDDTAAVARLGHPVTLVENPYPNPKLTVPADLPYLRFLLEASGGANPDSSSTPSRDGGDAEQQWARRG